MENEDYNFFFIYGDDYFDDLEFIVVLEEFFSLEGRVVRIFLVVVYSIVCFFGILGNGLVIVIVIFKMKKIVNIVWFFNLVMADFLFNVFFSIYIIYVVMDYYWVFGTVMCKISNFLFIYNMYISVFLFIIISFDRCIFVFFFVWF